MLQHLDNPGTLPQDKDLETLLQSCKDCQTSSVFDDSVISCLWIFTLWKPTKHPSNPALDVSITLPRSAIRDNQAVEESGSLKVANGNTISKAPQYGRTCSPKSVTDAASCTVTIDQMVDVSTDFRACFTASKATSARSSVVSTSSNTEITMMNKNGLVNGKVRNKEVWLVTQIGHIFKILKIHRWLWQKGPQGNLSVDNLKI